MKTIKKQKLTDFNLDVGVVDFGLVPQLAALPSPGHQCWFRRSTADNLDLVD